MIAAEFRMLLAESGMTYVELAKRLEIDEFDILKYQIGLRPIPPLVEYAFLWIIKAEQTELFLSGN